MDLIHDRDDMLAGYSLPATAAWFLAGGAVTAVFSGSLVRLAVHADLAEVLKVGMLVPCFTWVVQMTASAYAMPLEKWRRYWGALGRVCLIGSVALLPMGVVNLAVPGAPLWLSAANVLASVAIMAACLFPLSAKHGIAVGWPISWCITICVNMTLFVLASRHWW